MAKRYVVVEVEGPARKPDPDYRADWTIEDVARSVGIGAHYHEGARDDMRDAGYKSRIVRIENHPILAPEDM